MFRFIVFFILMLSVICCQRNCKCEESQGLQLGLISFDSAEINTVVMRKFKKGNNFNGLIETIVLNGQQIFRITNDTSEMKAFTMDMLLQSKFDYEVNVSSINRTYKITEINEPQTEGNCSYKRACVNQIVSCKVDGNFVSTAYYPQTLYLKK